MAIVKTLPFRYKHTNIHQEFLIQNSIPIIYSLWEGFVKNIFTEYISYINKLDLDIGEYNINLIVHTIDKKYPQFTDTIVDYSRRKKFIQEFLNDTKQNKMHINSNIETKSNVNLKVLNSALNRINLPKIDNTSYEIELNKLLKFRNSVAHGDNSISVSIKNIEEFSFLITNLMTDLSILFEKAIIDKKYLN